MMLDSDDYIDENIIAVEYLFMSMNSNWGAVSCDYIKVDSNEKHIKRFSGNTHPIACGIIFRIEHLIDIGLYDETFLLHEERDLRFRFTKKYS